MPTARSETAARPASRARRVARAAAAGVVATIPMTALMLYLHRVLPRDERYPLPPRLITDEVAGGVEHRMGLAPPPAEGARMLLTLVGHFAYGGAAGALYGFAPRAPARTTIPRGTAFGLAVWAGSYLGWLPALGILRPATEHPPRRSALMIAAHVLWGSATALLADVLDSTAAPRPPASRRSDHASR